MIKREDGQSLVEFALVIPLLLMLVVGVFDFGRVMFTHLNMEAITQEAVRLGGLGEDDAAIESYAFDQFDGEDSKLNVFITNGEITGGVIDSKPGSRESGDYVTVTLTYPESFMDILGDASIPYTVETSSTIRVE